MTVLSFTPYVFQPLPLSNVTPFTYREGYTYVSMVEALRNYVNTMIDSVNNNTASALEIQRLYTELAAYVNATISQLITDLNDSQEAFADDYATQFHQLRVDLITIITNASRQGTAFDPTRGDTQPIDDVFAHVYDALRIYAYSAGEYDALDLDADGYADRDSTAYEYDIYGRGSNPHIAAGSGLVTIPLINGWSGSLKYIKNDKIVTILANVDGTNATNSDLCDPVKGIAPVEDIIMGPLYFASRGQWINRIRVTSIDDGAVFNVTMTTPAFATTLATSHSYVCG